MRKKLEVVELNKKEEKIILEEQQSLWVLFWKKYNKLFLILLLIVTLTTLITSIFIVVSNLSSSDKMIIKEVSVDTDLDVTTADVTSSLSLTDETAKNIFKNNGKFKNSGEVLLVKTVSKEKFTIKFYSDYTAIKIMENSNVVTRIDSINGESYGIDENGVTNSNAKFSDVFVKNTKNYPWGTVVYYSDGSASIVDSKIDMFVRNANDINENYISNNRVTYLKDRDNIKGIKLNYYYDGTIEVVKNNTSYLVRSVDDITITDNNVVFKNNNRARLIETKKLFDGNTIYYYSDGGAIIKKGNETISVRKSNSIIIKDNKIFEIVDNIYVTVCDTKDNGNVIYYTNGSAVIKDYNGKTIYVSENSNIKYDSNNNINVSGKYESLTDTRGVGTDRILEFEKVSVVETDRFIAIVPSENVLYDSDGSLKEILSGDIDIGNKPIKISNNTNDTIKYRLVIERSDRTNVDVQYIKYQLSVGNTYVEPTRLDSNIWKIDKISDALSVTGVNYILIEKILLPTETDEIRLMLWTDYDRVPNSMQNKYLYGTIRIYAWQELENDI